MTDRQFFWVMVLVIIPLLILFEFWLTTRLDSPMNLTIVQRDSCTALQYIIDIVENAYVDDWARSLCWPVLNDPAFATAWASIDKHHAYDGGLVVHTAEVLDLCLQAITIGPNHKDQVDLNVLLTAAVWHDCLKTKCYARTVNGDMIKTPYYHMVGHVAGAHAEFCHVAERLQLTAGLRPAANESTIMQIQHCILSHHGKIEWRSPVEPVTIEAKILHAADMQSAHGSAEPK